jgi:histone acetyltransferase
VPQSVVTAAPRRATLLDFLLARLTPAMSAEASPRKRARFEARAEADPPAAAPETAAAAPPPTAPPAAAAPPPTAPPAADAPAAAPAPPAAAPAPAPAASAPPPLPVQDTYCLREARHTEREAAGELRALYVANDGSPESAKALVGLKCVLAKCLPNMPKTYIARLVFDRRHRAVVIVRGGHTVIGGIAYRPFHERGFAEIAFCAVAQTLQVAGFGTRLMNWTKRYARERDRCEFFLTFADNAAVGYFAKQGFTKAISMPRERWHGFIKDYDGGTLMECSIHPTLPFTEVPALVARQRAALDEEVRRHSTAHVVHPGLARWRAARAAGAPPPPPLAPEEIPGVREAGWDAAAAAAAAPRFRLAFGGAMREATPANLSAFMKDFVARLLAHEYSWPFRAPVSAEEVPDYPRVILNPVDLATMAARLEAGGHYTTLGQFAADLDRMWLNAKTFNTPDTEYWRMAHRCQGVAAQWLNAGVHEDAAAGGA